VRVLETVLRSDLNPIGFARGILNDVDESGHYEIPARYTAKGDAPYSSNVQFVGDTETP